MGYMKAVVLNKYGSPEVLKLKEIEKPSPKDNELLIKVYAATAHVGDTRIRKADPFLVRLVFGLFKPKKNLILGLEVSGKVESVGKKVKLFKEGDEVFALTGFGLGGNAEYICLPEKVKDGRQEKKGVVALKPKNLSFEEAAVVPAGALTALKNMHKANLQGGQEILINGASGSLGTFAIQLAKYYGAKVTAVCSANNSELVKSIGADNVIDYTREDFTKTTARYDVVYDAVMKSKKAYCKKILKKAGVFVNNYGLPKILEADFLFLVKLIEENKLKPILDRAYDMEEIIEAHKYVDKGHKKGNVVIKLHKD